MVTGNKKSTASPPQTASRSFTNGDRVYLARNDEPVCRTVGYIRHFDPVTQRYELFVPSLNSYVQYPEEWIVTAPVCTEPCLYYKDYQDKLGMIGFEYRASKNVCLFPDSQLPKDNSALERARFQAREMGRWYKQNFPSKMRKFWIMIPKADCVVWEVY